MKLSLWCGSVLAALVLASAVATGADAASEVREPSRNVFVLEVALTLGSQVSSAAREMLVREAERIWRREGVRLAWRHPLAPPRSDAPFRVLVIDRPSEASAGTWMVGELVRTTPERAVAIVSIPGARRVLDEAWRASVPSLPEDLRLGLVLGRALAHEIGHYLLGTRDHSPAGLMRADFTAREFADIHAGAGFLLHEADRRWMRERQLRQLAGRRVPTVAGLLTDRTRQAGVR